jgi:predicted dinucleotide-binding enzyme
LAIAVTAADAAKNEVVILAVNWVDVETVVTKYRSNLEGKILIDATNPMLKDLSFVNIGETGASELIAALIPGTIIVKAFNSLVGTWISGDPKVETGRKVVFVSGDHAPSNLIVSEIITKMGFFPLLLGSLYIGGLVQQAGKPLAAVNMIRVGN